MTHVYVTTVLDSNGKNVTGNFNQKDFVVRSTSNYPNQATGIKNATLNFREENNTPLISLIPSNKENIIGSPKELFNWLYYADYTSFTIDNNLPRYQDDKRIYMSPQGIVRDDETGDIYISFNFGSMTEAVNHGGPERVVFSGLANEWVNIVPIIKFNSSGTVLGMECVIGGTHELNMSFVKTGDQKFIYVAAYDDGVGTRGGDTKPIGYNTDWDDYYISKYNTSYYKFNINGMFTTKNVNSSELLQPEKYIGTGTKMTKVLSSSEYGAKTNSEIHADPFRNIFSLDLDSLNLFRFDDETKTALNYLKIQNIKQGSVNTYQSACLRGGHIYSSFGNSTNKPEIRISLINKGNLIVDNQCLVERKVFSDTEITDFYETEGIWVDETESFAYFIIKKYNSTDNQKSTMRVFEVPLTW